MRLRRGPRSRSPEHLCFLELVDLRVAEPEKGVRKLARVLAEERRRLHGAGPLTVGGERRGGERQFTHQRGLDPAPEATGPQLRGGEQAVALEQGSRWNAAPLQGGCDLVTLARREEPCERALELVLVRLALGL